MKKSFIQSVFVIIFLIIFVLLTPFVFADEQSSNTSIPISQAPPIYGNPETTIQNVQKLESTQPPSPTQPSSVNPASDQQQIPIEITPPTELPPIQDQQPPTDINPPPTQPMSSVPAPWYLSFWFIATLIIIFVFVILIIHSVSEGKIPERLTNNKINKEKKVKIQKKSKK